MMKNSTQGGESGKFPSGVSNQKIERQKRPASLIIGPMGKKRRCIVNRTHSPRTQNSPLSSLHTKKAVSRTPSNKFRLDVRNICPTLRGVIETARLLREGNVVVIPTESVYMTCISFCPSEMSSQSTLQLLHLLSSASEESDKHSPIILMKQPFSMLNRLVHLLQKPYAILQ